MGKKRVISVDLDSGLYREFIEKITGLAKARLSSYVCVANVHMIMKAWQNYFHMRHK